MQRHDDVGKREGAGAETVGAAVDCFNRTAPAVEGHEVGGADKTVRAVGVELGVAGREVRQAVHADQSARVAAQIVGAVAVGAAAKKDQRRKINGAARAGGPELAVMECGHGVEVARHGREGDQRAAVGEDACAVQVHDVGHGETAAGIHRDGAAGEVGHGGQIDVGAGGRHTAIEDAGELRRGNGRAIADGDGEAAGIGEQRHEDRASSQGLEDGTVGGAGGQGGEIHQ